MKFCDMPNYKRLFVQIITICVIAVLLVANSLLLPPTPVNATTGDEVRAAKKIVSVVYDDSGSMHGNRCSYANYSLQALTALMNEQDELYVTFMHEPDGYQQISLSSLQDSVNSIRDMNDSGYTPEQAIDTAMSVLDGISEDDPTTQFWLIVMTDGEVYANTNDDNSVIDIQSKLDSYKNKTMSNGSTLNIVYLGMVGAATVTGDPAGSLYSFMPDDDSGIVSAMRDISNLVSSRIVADSITWISSNEIQVTSNLPCYSISVLSQKSSAYIVSAKTDELDLNVQRNISLDATDIYYGESMPSLYGNAGVINYKNGDEMLVIPAGTYNIVFSDEVDVNNVVVQFEPAISFKTEITRNGVVLGDETELEYDDKVSIKLIPIIPGTDEVIPAETLPDDMTWNIEYLVDGVSIASAQTDELTDVTIQAGSNCIKGTILIPGFAPYIKEQNFDIVVPTPTPTPTPTPPPVYNFDIVVEEPDIYVPAENKPEDFKVSGVTYDRSEIRNIVFDESNTVKFIINNDGVPLSVEEQQNIGVSLVIDSVEYTPSETKGMFDWLASKLMNCRLEQNPDGSYSLIPEVPFFFFTTLFIKEGTYTAHVKLSNDDSVVAAGSFTLVRNKSEDAIPWIVIGILLFLLYMFICSRKHKFRNQTVVYEKFKMLNNGRGVQDHEFSTSTVLKNNLLFVLLVPYKACVKSWNGFTFVADSDGFYVTGKSIANKYRFYGVRNQNPVSNLGAIAKRLDPTKDKNKCVANDTGLQQNQSVYLSDDDPKSFKDKSKNADVFVYRLKYEE